MRPLLPLAAVCIALAACSATSTTPRDGEASAGRAGATGGDSAGGAQGGAGAGPGGAGGAELLAGSSGAAGEQPAGAGGVTVQPLCAPGEGKLCTCEGGAKGLAPCLPDRSDFGVCSCATGGAGGTGGAGAGGEMTGGAGAAGYCEQIATPVAAGTGAYCIYRRVAANDACGPECGTGEHRYTCNAGVTPPPAAGTCVRVGGDLGDICCSEGTCVSHPGGGCEGGRTWFTCPGDEPPNSGCQKLPAGGFCCF